MFGVTAPKSGMQMMVEGLVSAAGIDPEEIKASVNKVVQTGVDLSTRVSMIETKLNQISSDQATVIRMLDALLQIAHSTLPGGVVPAGDDGLFDSEHNFEHLNGAIKET